MSMCRPAIRIRWGSETEQCWIPERANVIAGLPEGLDVRVGVRVGVRVVVGVSRMVVMHELGIRGAITRLRRRRRRSRRRRRRWRWTS
jgi:hypothetical protein